MTKTISDTIVQNNNGYQLHYCKTDDGKTYIYNAPDKIDANTQVVVYVPGTGGAYPDFENEHGSANGYLQSMVSNHENCILIVPKNAQGYANKYNGLGQLKGEVDANALEGMVSDVLGNYNLPSTRLTTNISWSNGTAISLKMGASFLAQEGNNASPKTFMLINSAQYTPDIIDSTELQALADSKSNIILMSEDSDALSRQKYQKWGDNYGIKLYDINCNNYWGNSTHSEGNTVFANSGGLSALLGTSTLALPALFTFTQYNSSTKSWEQIDKSELDKLLKGLSSQERAAIQESYNDIIGNNYNALSNISDLSLGDSASDSNITSDYDFVATAMNNIRNLVRRQSESMATFNFPSLPSGSPLLSNIGTYLSNCSVILGSILDSLTLETESVVSYAQALVDMDNDLNGNLEKITMLPLPENYSAIPNLNTTIKEEPAPKTQDDNSPPDRHDDPPRGNYINEEPPNKDYTDHNKYKTGSVKIEKLVYTCNDGTNVYVTFDGNKITSLKQKFFCMDEKSIQGLYLELSERFKDNSNIEGLIMSDNGVEVIFKDSFYQDKNIEGLLATYFNGGEVNEQ